MFDLRALTDLGYALSHRRRIGDPGVSPSSQLRCCDQRPARTGPTGGRRRRCRGGAGCRIQAPVAAVRSRGPGVSGQGFTLGVSNWREEVAMCRGDRLVADFVAGTDTRPGLPETLDE